MSVILKVNVVIYPTYLSRIRMELYLEEQEERERQKEKVR